MISIPTHSHDPINWQDNPLAYAPGAIKHQWSTKMAAINTQLLPHPTRSYDCNLKIEKSNIRKHATLSACFQTKLQILINGLKSM